MVHLLRQPHVQTWKTARLRRVQAAPLPPHAFLPPPARVPALRSVLLAAAHTPIGAHNNPLAWQPISGIRSGCAVLYAMAAKPLGWGWFLAKTCARLSSSCSACCRCACNRSASRASSSVTCMHGSSMRATTCDHRAALKCCSVQPLLLCHSRALPAAQAEFDSRHSWSGAESCQTLRS